jgi:hypothetical protein
MNVTQIENSAVIVAVGTDGSLWYYWQTIGATGWNKERVAGPQSTTEAWVAQVGDSSVIAAVGQDQSLWFYFQTIGTGPWNPEEVEFPGVITAVWPTPVQVAQVGDSSAIVTLQQDNSLWYYWQTIGGSEWNKEQVAGPNSVPPAPVGLASDTSCSRAIWGRGGGLWHLLRPFDQKMRAGDLERPDIEIPPQQSSPALDFRDRGAVTCTTREPRTSFMP